MGHGGWKTPFPIRFGGNGHEVVENNYERIRQNLGDALSSDEDSATDGETQAQARLLGKIDSHLQNFVEQSNPRNLSTMLPRWETILGIIPSKNDSDAKRRRRVASRLATTYDATTEGIDAIARESFSPWTVTVRYVDLANAVSYWAGGTTHPDFDWYSTIAHIVVDYVRPSYASDDAVAQRESACIAALDEFAPAWATFDTHQTQTTGSGALQFGFFLDQTNLDFCCLD